MLWIIYIFDKYKGDIQLLTCVLAVLKNVENNGTEEIGLVTPTLELWMGWDGAIWNQDNGGHTSPVDTDVVLLKIAFNFKLY